MVHDVTLPAARVHEQWWQRLRTFVLVGPRRATEDWMAWAVTQAVASALLHLGYFLALVLFYVSGKGFGVGAQVFVGILVIVGSLLFCGIQWVVTLATMVVLAQGGRLLRKLPRSYGAALGAAMVAFAAVLLEPIGGVLYYGWGVHHWELGFWVVAAVTGALWGGWLRAVTFDDGESC